jgi:hypothetical protein
MSTTITRRTCLGALSAASAAHALAQPWKTLFDGKTLSGWKDPGKLSPAGRSWAVEDGCIKALANPPIIEDLVSEETYGDFELLFEWRISPGGNSGVKYRVQDFLLLPMSKWKQGTKFELFVDEVVKAAPVKRSDLKPTEKAQLYVIGFEF